MVWSSPLRAESFSRYHFKRALADAGLELGTRGVPGVRFHNLSHTHASWLARSGVRPEVVAKLLGYQDATTTLRGYTHLRLEGRADAVLGIDVRPQTRPAMRPHSAELPLRRQVSDTQHPRG